MAISKILERNRVRKELRSIAKSGGADEEPAAEVRVELTGDRYRTIRASAKGAIVPIGLVAFSCLVVVTLTFGDESERRPLDLPGSGKGWLQGEDLSDAPEKIVFFDHCFEGDAFVWVLDKSGSMAGERLEMLKHELDRAISQLSMRSEIGLVAFSSNFVKWRQGLRRADVVNKSRCGVWVNSLQAAGTTYVGPAGVCALEMIRQSRSPRRRVIIVGDGEPQDAGNALVNIKSANIEDTPIDTILISESEVGVSFMQQVAAENSGTFVRIVP